MRRVAGFRLVLAAAVAIGALTLTGLAGAGRTATCTASQLRGRQLDSTGAAGTIVVSVTLRNVGAACTLKGYAGLRLAAHAKLLPTRVARGGLTPLDQKARTVVLGRGGRSTILLAYSDVATGSETSCPRSTAILVRPPGQSRWLSVAVRATACNHGTLRESPVLAGVRHSP